MLNLSIRGALLVATAISLAGCVSTSSNTAVKDQLAVANQSIDALTAEKTSLIAQRNDLQDQLDAAGGDTAALEAAIAVLDGQIATLTASLTTAQNANRDYLKTAYNAVQDKTNYKNTMGTDAADVAVDTAALAAAEAKLAPAKAFSPAVNRNGQTLATYLAEDRASALQYAALMGLNPDSDTDQNKFVSIVDYEGMVSDLQAVVTDAEDALASTTDSYESNFGGHEDGSKMVLYSADGKSFGAAGSAIYRNTPDNTATGAQIPVVAKLTALFLLDDDGQPADVLVWEGSGSPFAGAPVGTATFSSDNMIAYFAQQENNGTYRMDQDHSGDAGALTLNFDSNTGTLMVNGLDNDANNMDYSINTDLAFNTATGTFTGTGKQAYTTFGGNAETADAVINGNLWGAAEAFTAVIDATDTTGSGSIPVHIMTALAGTGTSTTSD